MVTGPQGENIADADHLVVEGDAERARLVRAGASAREGEGAHLGIGLGAVALDDVEEVEEEPPAVVRGDERALALAPDERPLGDEAVDGLAHRADGHAESVRELAFGGDRLARAPLERRDALDQARAHLLVERTLRGRQGRELAAGGRHGGEDIMQLI